jgi:hypothetical protein
MEEHELQTRDNRMFVKIFGPERDELGDFMSYLIIIRALKSWRLLWAGGGARMRKQVMHTEF